MVKVYYWHPNTSDKVAFKKDKNDFGHISISAEHESENVYISFYPETELPLGSLILPRITVYSDLKTYAEDLLIMESEPDYVIEIRDLNSKLIFDYLQKVKTQKVKYNLYINNCANVVYNGLVNCCTARKYTYKYFKFKFSDNGMRDEKIALNNKLHGYGKLLYRSFEKAGFISPFRVLSFAKFISMTSKNAN